jgi:tetrahydromethanopterin S-methyltransferase subunit E
MAMPVAARLMLAHGLVGFGLATGFLIGLVWLDPGGVATLMLRAAEHPWPLALLWLFAGLTFGAVQIGIAIMQQGDAPPGGGRDRGG